MNTRPFASRESVAGEAPVFDDESGDSDSESRSLVESSHRRPIQLQELPQFPPLVSPSQSQDNDSVMDEEEIIRLQELRRSIRRRRLIIRPAVILVLGLLVFRNGSNRGFLSRMSFGDRSAGGTNSRNGNGLRLQQQFSSKTVVGTRSKSTSQSNAAQNQKELNEADVIQSSDKDAPAAKALFPPLSGNPIATAYNVVTDMNDDDSNNDLPATRGRVHNRTRWQSRASEDKTSSSINNNNKRNKKTKVDKEVPGSYGWVPELYPDPLIDPVRCGIAYLVAEQKQYHETGTVAEEERRGGGSFVQSVVLDGLCPASWTASGPEWLNAKGAWRRRRSASRSWRLSTP